MNNIGGNTIFVSEVRRQAVALEREFLSPSGNRNAVLVDVVRAEVRKRAILVDTDRLFEFAARLGQTESWKRARDQGALEWIRTLAGEAIRQILLRDQDRRHDYQSEFETSYSVTSRRISSFT